MPGCCLQAWMIASHMVACHDHFYLYGGVQCLMIKELDH